MGELVHQVSLLVHCKKRFKEKASFAVDRLAGLCAAAKPLMLGGSDATGLSREVHL